MDQLLTLLQQSIQTMQRDGSIIAENYRAMETMGDDIITAIESKEVAHG